MDSDQDFDMDDLEYSDDISIDGDETIPEEESQVEVQDETTNAEMQDDTPPEAKVAEGDARHLCRFFVKVNCKNGDECNFKHDDKEAALKDAQPLRNPNVRVYEEQKFTLALECR
jgi:hypothetical protein